MVREFAALLRSYRIKQVTGDRFAGGFPPEAFNRYGISYRPAPRTKSDAYVDLLALLNNGSVVLPRHERLVAQLVGTSAALPAAAAISLTTAPVPTTTLPMRWPGPRCWHASPATILVWIGCSARRPPPTKSGLPPLPQLSRLRAPIGTMTGSVSSIATSSVPAVIAGFRWGNDDHAQFRFARPWSRRL